MSLVFLHNSLLACLPGMHKFLFPIQCSSQTRAENLPAVPHLFQTAPASLSQDSASVGMGAALSFRVPLLMWGFSSIKYNIPSHLERDLIWPRREAVPEEVGKHQWERQRKKMSLSQPKGDFWWWAPRFSNQLQLCLALWTSSPILEVMLTILVL